MILNKYPSLRQDYQPIALGLLRTGILEVSLSPLVTDLNSIVYIFSHYYDCLPVVEYIIQRNSLLSILKDGSCVEKVIINRKLIHTVL